VVTSETWRLYHSHHGQHSDRNSKHNVAHLWKARLHTWKKHFECEFKDPPIVEHIAPNKDASLKKSFNFMGVDWFFDERKLRVDPKEQMEGLAEATTTSSAHLKGTHRDLASNVGKILWFHRFRSADRCTDDMQEFQHLFTCVMPPKQRSWDDLTQLNDRDFVILSKHWEMRRTRQDKTQIMHDRDMFLSAIKPCFAAVDASLGRNTEPRISLIM
jgi:hypothetical protein